MTRTVYPAAGRCIYCGSPVYDPHNPSRRLGDEHIVPEGLGGNLILPEASCKNCEGATSSFEGMCLRRMFGPMRIHLGLPSKRLRDRPTTLPVEVQIGPNDPVQNVEVPVSEHPAMFAIRLTDPPLVFGKGTAERGREVLAHFVASVADCNAKLERIRLNLNAHMVRTSAAIAGPAWHLMLAKIAHSFCVANNELDGFYPFLPEYISKKNSSNLDMFVGVMDEDVDLPTTELQTSHIRHSLQNLWITRGNQTYLFTKIRLFGNFGFTQYSVVVGRMYQLRPSSPCIELDPL